MRGSNRGSNENAKSDHLIGAYRSEPRLEPRDSFSRGSNESDVESDVDVIDTSDFCVRTSREVLTLSLLVRVRV